MPNESTQTMPNNSNSIALNNLYQVIKDDVNRHDDNPQLLLLIGIQMNDLVKVREAVETFGAQPRQLVTVRNKHIMDQMSTTA